MNDTHDMLMTMVTAISAGSLLIIAARRLNVPAIVALLIGGVLLGPATLGDHALVQPQSLGSGLRVLVSLAVGLILFEGGLTLDASGYRSVSGMIKRLLTVGVLITWLGTAFAIRFILGHELPPSIVAASLVIVTGPTVIAPLLKRIKVNAKLHGILHWEGVLIDPLGVFIAILCFEWMVSGVGGTTALVGLAARIGAGLGIGLVGGLIITLAVRRGVLPEDMINVGALALAVLIFGLAEAVRSEAGLLSVTVAGFVFGLSGSYRVKQIREFKAQLTDLLIGMLFILLSVRLSIDQFQTFGFRGCAVVLVVMLLVRPLSVLVCSWRLDLSGRERIFLSWVAPRGIVAASMASLFAIEMEKLKVGDDPRFVETFTYSVIVATIVLQSSTAGLLARWLGLRRADPNGWLIVGAHALARRIGAFIAKSAQVPVVLVDSNTRSVRVALGDGHVALAGDARDPVLQERPELAGVGHLLALTDNEDLNVRLCDTWGDVFGAARVHRCNPTGAEVTEQEGTAGTIVWPKLPRPSILASELARREAVTFEAVGDHALHEASSTPLVTTIDHHVILEDGPTGSEEDAATQRTLYLRRRADHLGRSLRSSLVTVLDAADLEIVIRALVDLVVRLEPALSRDEIVTDLLERERVLPSAIGGGVSIPHAYVGALDHRLCGLARLETGIDVAAPDGEPVRLVFLLLSPQGDPEGHLATLAEIARLVVDPDTRERLHAARTPEAMLDVVRGSGRR